MAVTTAENSGSGFRAAGLDATFSRRRAGLVAQGGVLGDGLQGGCRGDVSCERGGYAPRHVGRTALLGDADFEHGRGTGPPLRRLSGRRHRRGPASRRSIWRRPRARATCRRRSARTCPRTARNSLLQVAILCFRGILYSISEENDTSFTRETAICFRDAIGLRITQIAAALYASSVFCTRPSTMERHDRRDAEGKDGALRHAAAVPRRWVAVRLFRIPLQAY